MKTNKPVRALSNPPLSQNHQNIEKNADQLSADILSKHLPRRKRTAHKGDFGHVICIGGNKGFLGAILLTAKASLRVGAGLVSVLTHEDHAPLLSIGCPEIMSHGIELAQFKTQLSHLGSKKGRVIAIGPGLGKDEWAHAVLKTTLEDTDHFKVVDADALNLLSLPGYRRNRCKRMSWVGIVRQNCTKNRNLLSANEDFGQDFNAARTTQSQFTTVPRTDWILTPHPAEAGRLLGLSTEEIQANRHNCVKNLNTRYGGVSVLKGAGTLIDDGKCLSLCPIMNPGMATAGMGDVLTGVIAGLLAQGLPPSTAAKVGVYLHAASAQKAASLNGERGLIASDLFPNIQAMANPER